MGDFSKTGSEMCYENILLLETLNKFIKKL